MQVPKAPPALDRFTNLRFVLGRDGTNAVFVIDGTTGRAWVLARGRSAKWSDQRWRLLGRIGTPTAADLLFQAGLCLEFVPNVVDPDALRGNITDGVALNLKKALAGTPLDALIEAPEAVSRCINQRETLGLWIDHDINLPILRNTDILPRDQFALFALLVPEATIRRVFEEVWRTTPRELNWDGNPERHGAITLHGYDLTLKAPNQLVLSIEGSALSLDFHVRITGTFDAPGKKPWCSPRVEIDAPDAIISGISFLGVSLFMGLPVDYINQKFADAVEGKLGEKAPLLCKLSQALFSELYLPVPKDPAQAQILELSYDGVLVVSQGANTGILGYGSTAPQVRKREPHVELNVQPRIGTSAGIDRIQVDFKVTATDLKQPYTVEWLPSRPSTTTRLLSPETLRTSEQSLEARFEYEVAPSSVVRLYDLGAMTVTVTGSDGIARDVTESVSALTQPRKRQGP